MRHKPSDYVWIERWGQMMGSFVPFIRSEQEVAARDDAPLDAVYKKDGRWQRARDVENLATRAFFITRYGAENCPEAWKSGKSDDKT